MDWQILFLVSSFGVWTNLAELPPPCDSEIYCHGPLLHTIQMSGIYQDSKTFVDKKLKYEPTQVLENFDVLINATNNNPTQDDLVAFLDTNFGDVSSEFEAWNPSDWHPNPQFLSNVQDVNYRDWASNLHEFWKNLGRQINPDVESNQDLYSLIYVPNPFIVPGGRFREFYYWDSYWIIKGLLHSEMYTTVKGMLENFLSMVQNLGFVPNGGRVYYTRRSQPPLLIPSIYEYYYKTQDLDFIMENIDVMEQEVQFWLSNRTVQVNGHTLAQYSVEATGPRPESYKEDFSTAQIVDETKTERLYKDIQTGAESGWDLSTRWWDSTNDSPGNITHVRTSDFIPVDLNSYMCLNFKILIQFYELLGNSSQVLIYAKLYNQWKTAIQQVLWDEEAGVWFDYDLLNQERRKNFYPSNVFPLWAECYDPSELVVERVVNYLNSTHIFDFPGGVPTSLIASGQQWDYPNGWPPLQHLMIMGLEKTRNPTAQRFALQMAQIWVLNNYVAFQESIPNAMFEKYDVSIIGLPGGGGEYDVQLGFGWTNGIILDLLNYYGDRLNSEDYTSGSMKAEVGGLFFVTALFLIILRAVKYPLFQGSSLVENRKAN